MQPQDLQYTELKALIAAHEEKGRTESVAFLNWFLENIFRLDPIEADDCICDRSNDRGIDGLYVDHTLEEIVVLQGKVRQQERTIGDASLRDLAGAITQLDTPQTVQALMDGGGNPELKRLLQRNNTKDLVEKGYSVVGAFIANQLLDQNGQEFLDQHPRLRVYDRQRIAREFIDIDADGGVPGAFVFDTSYVAPMEINVGQGVKAFLAVVKATDLVRMNGIDDGSLFSQNVRQSLGNTKVNKALRQSVSTQTEHSNFPLYHNGVTILAERADLSGDELSVKDYVVVNGAQSISTFYRSANELTEDLRVLAKIIQLSDESLAKKITVNSNNQNAIKPRDLKSTNEVQIRLKKEFENVENGAYALEIKRGQEVRDDAIVISNEEAGRLLLAFDLKEPYSCHQVYKLFDEKYAEIFARPAVNAYRIIMLYQIMKLVDEATPDINFKPLARYGLTRFFMLSAVGELLTKDPLGKQVLQDPKAFFENGDREKFNNAIRSILGNFVVDLNFEVEDMGDKFDYKGDLKSQVKVRDLRTKLIRSFEKDVNRKKAESFEAMMA